jgi:nucleotide-binding universal stress UspA family protein
MTDQAPVFAVQRILAAFSSATTSRMALEGAVDVAARLGAELQALLVEDVALLELAELPYVRQVSTLGAPGGVMQRKAIEAELRALATGAERQLAEAARRRQIRCSFQHTRGRIEAAMEAAAKGVDLLILATSTRPLGREVRLEAALRTMIRQISHSVLLLQPNALPTERIHLVLEESAGRARAIQAAIQMAAGYASALDVTIWSTGPEQHEQLTRELAAMLPATGSPVRYRRMVAADPAQLDELIAATTHGTLVLDALGRLLEPEPAWQRIARAPCAILLVR